MPASVSVTEPLIETLTVQSALLLDKMRLMMMIFVSHNKKYLFAQCCTLVVCSKLNDCPEMPSVIDGMLNSKLI